MSEQMLHDDALEQQLRAHYASEFGQPPSPATIWMSLQEELQPSSHQEAGSITIGALPPTTTRPRTALPSHIHQTHPLRLRPVLSTVAAALLIVVFAALLLGPLGHARFGGGNNTATNAHATATPSIPAKYSVHVLAPDETWHGVSLFDLQMLSSDDGWAVGMHRVSSSAFESAILHYTHGRWTASPDVFPNARLITISMVSSTEGWAGGGGPTAPGTLLHYSDGRWISVQTPGPGTISQLAMLTPQDGWALQFAQTSDNSWETHVLHYDGSSWSTVDTGGLPIIMLEMLSTSEGWATCDDGTIIHFHNGKWTRWSTTPPGAASYITMVSPTDGWMAGLVPNHTNTTHTPWSGLFMLHYDGSDWRPVTLPTLPQLHDVYPPAPNSGDSNSYPYAPTFSLISGISMTSPTEGWAAGDLDGITSTLYHYSDGKWQLSPFAVNLPLSAIRMVSADEGWAISAPRSPKGSNTSVILHYLHGAWTVYKP